MGLKNQLLKRKEKLKSWMGPKRSFVFLVFFFFAGLQLLS